MNTSESIKEISPAMLSAVAELHNIAPNKQGYGYKYADLALIIDSSKPILLKHNLFIIQSIGRSEATVSITTRLQHASGEFIQDTFDLPNAEIKNGNNVQKMGASITYGRRYGLACLLGIAVDEDTDGVNKEPPKRQVNENDFQKPPAEEHPKQYYLERLKRGYDTGNLNDAVYNKYKSFTPNSKQDADDLLKDAVKEMKA